MKVKLLKNNRIDGKAGDIVEVDQARYKFLISMKLAEPAEDAKPEKPKKAAKPKEEKTEEKKPARKTGAKK